jgi:topoisomerase-4 subunit A
LKGHEVDAAALAFKPGDGLYGLFGCRSVDHLLVFGSNGRVYSVAVAALPGGRGDGQPITTLIDLEAGTQALHYYAGVGTQTLVVANTGGYGLLAQVQDLVSRQRGGKSFLTLEGEAKPLPPAVVPSVQGAALQLACLSLSNRLLLFPLDELNHQPKGGRGLTLIGLDEKDALVSVAVCTDALQVQGSGRGGRAKEEMLKGAALEAHAGRRARKGRVVSGMNARRLLPG